MARIRTIKPEFWDSPGIESLAFEWRLLFIAMWNWADDAGRGKAEARELMGFAFPRDENMTLGEFRRGLGEVRRVFGVTFYKVAGRSYYSIPSWDRHQKIDKRSGSKYPALEEGEPYDPATNSPVIPGISTPFGEPSGGSAETPPSIRRDSSAGTGEEGNRGRGDKHTCSPAPPSSERATRFDEFWDAYPRKVGKDKAKPKYAAAVRRAGNEQTVIDGAHRLATDPNLPEKQFIPYPTTWLERGGWNDEPLPARADNLSSSQRRLQQAREAFGATPEAYQPPIDPFAAQIATQARQELTQ